jgi:DNA modification methylase
MASEWLTWFTEGLKQDIVAIAEIDANKVETDIAARTRDVEMARVYVENRLRLIDELDAEGSTEAVWCRSLGRGHSLSQMLRRIQLLKDGAWPRYLKHRRAIGDNGRFGLEYAAHLATFEDATNSRVPRTPSANRTVDEDGHQFICGDALAELRKMKTRSVYVVVTSPPYWPARRLYVPEDRPPGFDPMLEIGFEPTLDLYFQHVVGEIFRELKRVLRHDGVLWVVIDDAIANPASRYGIQAIHRGRAKTKTPSQINLITQDTTKIRPKGNWLGVPGKFADEMMDDGWFHRDLIIWDKGSQGRKESTESRTRHSYESIFMFTKRASGYWYDQDKLRIPLVGANGYTVSTGYSIPRSQKPGVLRRDSDRDLRVASNPLGRVADAVWQIPPSGWKGTHSASFPEELVRRCLLLTAPPDALVVDPFGGAGTVALVAHKMGFRSIYIDKNPAYLEEAQNRLHCAEPDEGPANDNQPRTLAAD